MLLYVDLSMSMLCLYRLLHMIVHVCVYKNILIYVDVYSL